MEVIRRNIFETNSSSSHSYVRAIDGESHYDYDDLRGLIKDDGYMHSCLDIYGWFGPDVVLPRHKLRYALTMIAEVETYESEDEFYRTESYLMLNDMIRNIYGCKGVVVDNFGLEIIVYNNRKFKEFNGSIDHQSCENYSSLQEFLDDIDTTLEAFIFDTKYIMKIDNDNH